MHPESGKTIAQTIGNLVVEKWEKAITAVYESDVDSKSFEDGGIFATDDAAADDGEAFGNAIHLEKRVRVKRMNVVESDLRGAMGLGAGGDEDDVSFQAARTLRP